jgi:cell wall-associated NlpC family hydrolase
MTEQAQRAAVVKEALSWVGTPYHHHARIKGAGVDCGMIICEVYERAGVIPHVEPGEYVRDWHLHRDEPVYLHTLERYAARIEDPAYGPQPGDVSLFKYGRHPAHSGIVTQWPRILHAYADVGSVVEDDAEANADLASRFVGIWSFWPRVGV